ncbi:MAG: multidrug ABC transporter substrate-binding protein [Hyphomicrobiales bacterium]|nr:MAG: multidrug ABC transporter substrate-binding protein [Hyphomicrobiales bacterium]
MFFETLKLAIQAIRRNVLRSFLTLLGIVIGVGAVIAMVTIGNGTTAKVQADMAKLGSNLLFIRPGQFGPGRSSSQARPFNARDIAALRSQLGGVKAVAPVSREKATVVFGSQNRSVTIAGTDNAYFITQDLELKQGRRFLDGEVRSGRAVCLLGETTRRELFGGLSPVGRNIRINKISCEIIGLLEEKGESGFGIDQDDIVLMPLRTFQRRIAGNSDIGTVYISARDNMATSRVQAAIEHLLRERRHIGNGQEDDFAVADMKRIASTRTATTGTLTILLSAVAGVSLLVGGIGIMNIMLVSVTERTREIGIRLAIGAQEQQVLLQFLVEAIVLSLIGGILGVALGLGLAGIAAAMMKIPYIPDPFIVLTAFGFSALVGVIFGYFPARRAAHLNPIEALRHE